jgi:hypothetical protein
MAKRPKSAGRMIRKTGRKRSRIKIGRRAVLFFILATLILGGMAISENLRFEDRANNSLVRHASRNAYH